MYLRNSGGWSVRGEVYLQTEAPIGPSSLTRWRKRIGEEGVETLRMACASCARAEARHHAGLAIDARRPSAIGAGDGAHEDGEAPGPQPAQGRAG